jgi:hypothetical protein
VRVDNIPATKVKFKKDKTAYKTNVYASDARVLRYTPSITDKSMMVRQLSDAAIGIGSGAFPMCNHKFWKCSPKYCGHWKYCRGSHSASVYIKQPLEAESD